MASPIGRVSAIWSVGLSLAAAAGFFGLATWIGDAPLMGMVGGAVWVFVLSMIVALPLVTGWVKRRYVGPGPGARWARGEGSTMALTVGMWMCTLPFLVLLLGPWLGWPVTALVAAAWMAVIAAVCLVLCVTRADYSHTRGGAS